jgi:hypothetical protein
MTLPIQTETVQGGVSRFVPFEGRQRFDLTESQHNQAPL